MKKLGSLLVMGTFAFYSCTSDDAPTVELEHEHELITTVIIELEDGEGNIEEFVAFDEDGDGADYEIEIDDIVLAANTEYTGTLEILNESEHDHDDEEEEEEEEDHHEGDNVTNEIIKENTLHQFFYTPSDELNVTVDNLSQDDNGDVFGLDFTLTTGDVSEGSLNVTLLHESVKPNTDIETAGGSEDFNIDFPVFIEEGVTEVNIDIN